jgi:L-fuconolactonase
MLPFPIVDSHLHLWDLDKLHYPWLADVPFLNRTFLLEDFREACGSVEVESMVFLQCEVHPTESLNEAKWVISLARKDNRIKGIVPSAPLEKGDGARKFLEELTTASPLIKGIRRVIQFEPDLDFCLRPDFVRGVQALADYDLSFDICISHIHLANTIRMVERCPKVSFILDHIGKPDIKEQLFEPWMRELRELASFPNVHCKMSGLVTEADLKRWTREELKPYIDHTMDCFGPDRVIYGGDWPVAFQATDYPRWVETLNWALRNYSLENKRKIFHDNAVRFYRLTGSDKRV